MPKHLKKKNNEMGVTISDNKGATHTLTGTTFLKNFTHQQNTINRTIFAMKKMFELVFLENNDSIVLVCHKWLCPKM